MAALICRPQSVSELGNCLFQLAATLIFNSTIQPYFLAGAVPLMVVYYFVQKVMGDTAHSRAVVTLPCRHVGHHAQGTLRLLQFYRRSYIELQRVDATTRSPIYTHFSETLAGVETLRAYGFETRFALENESKVDYNHRYVCYKQFTHPANLLGEWTRALFVVRA